MAKAYLAPVFDYTDIAFRIMCQRHGADGCYYPIANSESIARDARKAKEIDSHPDEENSGIQIVGGNPDMLGKTAEIIADEFGWVDNINLNCGCPSPRTMKSGGGSELLGKPKLLRSIIQKMSRCPKRISIKIRLLPDFDKTMEICRLAEEENVAFIIVHGRTPQQGYSGNSDYKSIRKIHDELDIPVIGNGDVATRSAGDLLVKNSVCDSFMIGRAAMANPSVFENKKPDRVALFQEYADLIEEYDQKSNLQHFRMKAMNFACGMKRATNARRTISSAKSVEDLLLALSDQ